MREWTASKLFPRYWRDRANLTCPAVQESGATALGFGAPIPYRRPCFSGEVPALRSAIPRCISTSQWTASTTLANSAKKPSPVFFTTRPRSPVPKRRRPRRRAAVVLFLYRRIRAKALRKGESLSRCRPHGGDKRRSRNGGPPLPGALAITARAPIMAPCGGRRRLLSV
jgi:hypothetical protein